jgi:hypothetical protein
VYVLIDAAHALVNMRRRRLTPNPPLPPPRCCAVDSMTALLTLTTQEPPVDPVNDSVKLEAVAKIGNDTLWN